MTSQLISSIRMIQRALGLEVDGIFGQETANGVLKHLASVDLVDPSTVSDEHLDARTMGIISTLDAKARPAFVRFMGLAKATAATLGCDYRLVSGNRSWAEQDALYEQGRDGHAGAVVTNARGGFSNHNFGIAADAGVFRCNDYLDGGDKEDQETAQRVHEACALHAVECGLDWGGHWQTIVDIPHYEFHTGLTMAEKRNLFAERGSVL